MNRYPLSSLKRLPVLLLSVALATAGLPAETQSQDILPATQVAQSSNDAQLNEIQKKAEQFVDLLGAQEFAKVREALHPDLSLEWSPEKIERIWQELLAETGSFKKRGKSRVIKTVTGDLVFVSVEFENTTDDLLVTFNPNQQIIGVDFPKTESIEEIAEKVVDALVAQNFASARGYLHPFLKEEIFPQQVQQKWQALLTETGPFKKRVSSEVRRGSTIDDVDVVFVTIEFEKVTDDLIVIFDHNKRIVNVDFPELE